LADFAFTGEVNLENTIRIILLVAFFFATAPVLAAVMSRFIHIYDIKYRKLPGLAYLLRGVSKIKKLIIGTSMVPRGEVGLIFAELGRVAKVFTNETYSAVVFIVILTTLVPPFIMKYLFKLEEKVEK